METITLKELIEDCKNNKTKIYCALTEEDIKFELEESGITPETVGKERYKDILYKTGEFLEDELYEIENLLYNSITQAEEHYGVIRDTPDKIIMIRGGKK